MRSTLQWRSDRRAHRPYGIVGGWPGAASSTSVWTSDGWQTLPTKFIRTFEKGQSIRHVTAGGGGAGDPLARDPERVLDDVREGRVSAQAALELYRVVVRPDPWQVDYLATQALRDAPEDGVRSQEGQA
jgi:N-methylhydantoinase B